MLPKLHQHAWMTDDLDTFRDQVRRYVEGEMAPKLEEWRHQGYIPREIWQAFGSMGFLLPEIDEEYGGAGAPLSYQMAVQEVLARAEVGPHVTVHSIATHYIADFGTDAQKRRWLTKLVSGEMFAGIAMTEPGCGSDLKALRTRARCEGDEWVIDGAKTFITNGWTGNLIIVAARTSDDGSRGVSLFVVETENLKGFRVGRKLEKIGQHTSDTVELFFDSVRIPADALLGEKGKGFPQLMSQLPYERLLIAVNAVANIERAVELTVEYTRSRKMFGQTLYDLQNTRFKLAECATTAHIARSFINDCIQRLLDGHLDFEAAYMAKWWCAEQMCKVADECLQLFGGYGYTVEYPIARIYADARVMRIYGGATEVMKDLIARKLGA